MYSLLSFAFLFEKSIYLSIYYKNKISSDPILKYLINPPKIN